MVNYSTMTERRRILAVDDEVEVCHMLQELLEQKGYEVITAHRGDAAIALAQSRHPDLILLDVLMPGGIDGVQTYHRLKGKSSTRNIPVIFVTAVEPAGSVRNEKLPLGEQCAVIGKPFRFEQLFQTIERLLATSAASPPRHGPKDPPVNT